jgi:hypothetical protein
MLGPAAVQPIGQLMPWGREAMDSPRDEFGESPHRVEEEDESELPLFLEPPRHVPEWALRGARGPQKERATSSVELRVPESPALEFMGNEALVSHIREMMARGERGSIKFHNTLAESMRRMQMEAGNTLQGLAGTLERSMEERIQARNARFEQAMRDVLSQNEREHAQWSEALTRLEMSLATKLESRCARLEERISQERHQGSSEDGEVRRITNKILESVAALERRTESTFNEAQRRVESLEGVVQAQSRTQSTLNTQAIQIAA